MTQRREQVAAPGGSTALVFSGHLGAVSKSNKDSVTLACPLAPYSRSTEATRGHTAAAQGGELSTQCAKNTAVSIT